MNQYDQELLDKQLRGLNPSPRNDGVMSGDPRSIFCWHHPWQLPVCIQKRTDANRMERCDFLPNGVPPTTRQ